MGRDPVDEAEIVATVSDEKGKVIASADSVGQLVGDLDQLDDDYRAYLEIAASNAAAVDPGPPSVVA